jgi:surface antigen
VSTNFEAWVPVEQLARPTDIVETSRLHGIVEAGKRVIGRTALALGLATGLIAAEAATVEPRPAMADTGGYPDVDAVDCSGQYGQYSWCKDENGNGSYSSSEQYSSRGYSYRNCTDWVAWRIPGLVQMNVPTGWGNAKNWDNAASAGGHTVDATPEPGDIAVWDDGSYGHVAVVESTDPLVVSEYNHDEDGNHGMRTNPAGIDHYIDLNGTGKGINGEDLTGGSTPPPSSSDPLSLLDFSDAIWSKKNLGVGWTQETGPSSAKSISAGGSNRTILDQCNAVWTKTGDPSWSGWTQETGCYAGSKAIVSSTGVRMILDFCGGVWAKNGAPGMGGWVQETGCDGVKDIAAGGDNQLLLNACNQVWSKPGIGFGGWTPESDCGGAEKIAISSTGVKVVINGCGSVWAKKPGHGWAQETGCDGVKAIAAGEGENQLLLNACDAVWSKPGVGFGGWTQETDCGAAKAIAMGSNNRRAILDFGDAIWAKDSSGYGGWSQQAGAGSAKAVDVG